MILFVLDWSQQLLFYKEPLIIATVTNMAHFALLWKARTIEKYRQNYENEKINSIIMSNADIPDKTLLQRWRHYSHGMQKRLSRKFSKWYPEGTTVSNFFVSVRTDMKLASILLRSLYGFIGGLLLTYLGFMFFVFQLSLSLMHATVLSSVMGVLLTLGLTFSNRMRCLIFLLIPQLFSRVGRYTLTCYALVLILTGPATNTLKNSEVLSESMACSQEQIKLNVRHINDSIKKPFNPIRDSLKITIGSMKLIVRNLKIALIRINRLILSIASVIQSRFSWLISVVDKCNEALGTPMDKCHNAIKENSQKHNEHVHQLNRKDVMKSHKISSRKHFGKTTANNLKKSIHRDNISKKDVNFQTEEVVDNIKRSKDKDNPWFCKQADVTKLACDYLSSYEKFCEAADFTEETILATVRKKLKTFTQRLSSLFRLKLNIHHTYTFISNSSSTNQVAAGIITEIRNRADPIITWLSWSSCVTSLFLLLIIFRAKHYQHMFETRSPFDNRFITKEFRELDLKRLREGRETVLPLNSRERAKYVTTTSFRLVASEKVHLNRSAVFMTITTFKLMIHIVADYSLYWVLTTIRHHGKLQSPLKPGIADTGAFISGSGFVARLLQSFIDAINLQLMVPPSDNSCLPNPYPPDFKRYCQIGFLIFLLWFFALLEPYGLRLRHLIMGHHRPERAKTRAVWLYNHILRTRASFMKFARRRLHREYKYSSQSTLTFRQWMRTHIPFRWLKYLLGIRPEMPRCLLCNITEDSKNLELIKCEVRNCPGTYCTSCFSDIGQLCTICLCPSDYGDLSDVSLEKGSSDEYDSDDDCDPRDTNTSSRRNSEDRFNAYNDDAGEDSSKNKFGKQNSSIESLLLFRERNENSETYPLIQNNYTVLYINNLKWSNNDVIRRIIPDLNKIEIILIKQIENTIEKCEKKIATFKDVNNNMCWRTPPGLVQYSVYEITLNPFVIKKLESTTRIAKYLRRNKFMRRKQKALKPRQKYFMTCSNNNIEAINGQITQVNGNEDQTKKSNNNETNNDAKNNIPTKNTENKKYCEKDTTIKYKRSIVELQHFHMRFTKYWKNVKLKVLPCSVLMNSRRDLPPIKEKKHNRKKKHTNITYDNSRKEPRNAKLKNKEPNIGNSRLFAYLDELDWIDNSFDDSKKVNDTEELCKDKQIINDGKNMVVNNILIPRLDLKFSTSGSIVDQQVLNTSLREVPTASKMPSTTARLVYAKDALDRFFKSIVCQSYDVLESKRSYQNVHNELFNKGIEINSVHESKCIAYPNLSICDAKQNSNKSKEVFNVFRLKRLSNPVSFIKSAYSSIFSLGNKSHENNEGFNINKKRTQTHFEKHIKWKSTQMEKRREKQIQTRTIKKDQERTNKRTRNNDNDQNGLKDEKHTVNKEKERTENNAYDKEIQTFSCFIETADKGTGVCPLMNSCGFQKNIYKVETHDCAIQKEDNMSRKRPISQGYDVEVMAAASTCTCAAQCEKSIRNVGVFTDGQKNNACTCVSCRTHDSMNQTTTKEFGFKVNGRLTHGVCARNPPCNHCDVKPPPCNKNTEQQQSDDSEISKEEELSCSSSSSEYISSKSEDSKTDTTVCSLANMDYYRKNRRNVNEKPGRIRVKVVTKANQSTLTDRTEQCDVSTTTYDWWSPIVEKKDVVNKVEKKRGKEIPRERKRKIYRSTGINTTDKVVKFKSTAQLIPIGGGGLLDIMSPSRYLLESQKYYNELFCNKNNKFNSPRVFPVTNVQKSGNTDRERSQINSHQGRHHSRRVRKTKRLEESYTPKKPLTPRKKGMEFVRSLESPCRGRRNRHRD